MQLLTSLIILFIFQLSFAHAQDSNLSGNSSPSLGAFHLSLRKDLFPDSAPKLEALSSSSVYFCLRLNPSPPLSAELFRFLDRIEIVLEAEGNAQRILGVSSSRFPLKPDANGCFIGVFRIPENISSTNFKVAEIDLWTNAGKRIPLRGALDRFSTLASLSVRAGKKDSSPPELRTIETLSALSSHLRFGKIGGRRAWGEAQFKLVAEDLPARIDPKSLRIFFKVFVDGGLSDILEPKCRSTSYWHFDCKLYFSRASFQLKNRKVDFVLDSISLSDRAGNEMQMNDPEKLKELFGGELLQYHFGPQ